jgi:hypothetical protein
VILGLLALVLVLLLIWALLLPAPNRNALAIGERAALDELAIALQPPQELDYMRKAEVLRLREGAVNQHPELLAANYRPSDAIFDQIVNGLPWWGIAGQFYYGRGERSIEGPSEESRFILNPYLLAAAEFYTRLDNTRIPESKASQPGFRFYCEPYLLHWQPRRAYAEAHYRASCVESIGGGFFDLIAYNARDLNLNYIYVSYPDSQGISKGDAPITAYANPQYIHRGGSCGYPGGCNNMSPRTPEIDGIRITRLPAKVVIWLWEEDPGDPLEGTPDMTFVLRFK